MPFTIGLQTVKHLKIEEILQTTLDYDLNAFEIFFDGHLPRDLTERVKEMLSKVQKTANILLSIHAPLISTSKSYWFRTMHECLLFAQRYGASLFTIHPDPTSSQFLQKAKTLIELAQKEYKELTILIENTPSTPANMINEFFDQLHQFKNVGFTFDIGHAQLSPISSATRRKNAINYLEVLEVPILECHVHTNRGKKDEHLSIQNAAGVISLKEVIRNLIDQKKFSGPFIFEYFRGNMEKDLQMMRNWLSFK